jgi:DNA-directed RNA polymerase II subunit RPB1
MSSLYNELNYTENIKEIKGVQFGVLSPDEIKKRSVVHVTQTVLYDGHGEPIVEGLFDSRMGVIDHGKICPTDNLDNRFCPGYFGHIELSRPVFHIQFIQLIIKILKCICIRCSNLLIDVNDPELSTIKNKKKLFTSVVEKCSKVNICGTSTDCGCGALQPSKYIKEGLSKIYAEWKDKSVNDELESDNKQLLTAEFIHKIFLRITDMDCDAIGLSPKWCRPDWLICSILPVPPPSVRPSVRQSGGMRSEDDITHKLIDIIKTNNHLKRKIENEKSLENTVDEWTQVLQYHVATLVDNELPGISAAIHRSGRALKTLKQRLKGKEGRIRGNLMGKRVDYSARSVITPDPNIEIDQLGVPKKVAMNLTYPDVVTIYNKDKLYKYVRNGPFKHPGAKSIKKKIDGKTTSLQYVDVYNIILNEGDIVHRHLDDDDVVLFNRQPSLHKMSMMGHRVKVMEFDTFRLNVSVTKPYNADFDGDEMNMHVPQSVQTKAELLHLTLVPLQIISPREHKPVISLVQDSLLGINRITNDDVYLNREEMMNILIYIDRFDGVLPKPDKSKPYERWSGRQLISMAFPKTLDLEMKNNAYNDDLENDVLNHVIIKSGVLLQGRIDSKIMNSGTRGLIHVVFNDYGSKVCKELLDDLQNIVTRFLVLTGFSVGIGDLVANKETDEQINKIIINTKKQVSKLNTHVHKQIFENTISESKEAEFEKRVNNLLNKAISEAGKVGLKSLSINNRMTNMVSAGSKGKTINVAQMIACLGQQNVDGKRISNSYNNRTLPNFTKYDISPESKGFVESSFIQGLQPHEFFFHAMGGREGLIDTAVKTSETGYIQRKLIKAMEDLKVYYDLSVRNAYGNIIQFMYGEDGMHYIKIINQTCDLLTKTYDKLEQIYKFDVKENYGDYLVKSVVTEIKSDKEYNKVMDGYYNKLFDKYHFLKSYVFKNSVDGIIRFPINLYRLINSVKATFSLNTILLNINPKYIINKIYELESYLRKDTNNGVELFICLIYDYLSPKKVLKMYKLNKLGFDYLIETIKLQYNNSRIDVSEMVGPIAAQSIGEPATQMTLNTFHFAGVSSKSNVTRGVPRLKELLHISKNQKSPSTTIYLEKQYKYDKAAANDILNNIELTSAINLIKSINIYYDPDDNNTEIEDDKDLLRIYKLFNDINPECESESQSNMIIRIEFDKQEMINKNITMEDIYYKINMLYGDEMICKYNDDNSSKLIFRIRLLKIKKSEDNDINILKNIANDIRENVIIKGIKNISSVSMYKNKQHFELENKSYIQKEEWVLNTNGINLLSIFNTDKIDYTRTISNDIYEVYELLGIEAARTLLLNEIKEVIESSGEYVNYRHLSLLVDTMTNRGNLMSIDRFGINRGNIGPLAKCSFEETTDQLFKAAIFGEVDNLTGVSSNIMMGQIPPCGTGDSNILIDESKLIDIYADEEVELDDIDNWVGEDYCSKNVGINFSSKQIKGDNMDNIPMPNIEL